MKRTQPSTAPLRVLLGIVVAFSVPSALIGVTLTNGPPLNTLTFGLRGLIAGPFFGLMIGWPYVLGSAMAWAVLHSLRLARWWSALAVGAVAGLVLAGGSAQHLDFVLAPGLTAKYALLIILGGATGYLVWLAAYWRRRAQDGGSRADGGSPRSWGKVRGPRRYGSRGRAPG